ncbi:MAG TPA: hypothetical protein VM942_03495 [Acidimicrobiales bacterium]|nr:hypothetical protein [Acidimicrobiales bacterium]
MRFTLSLVAGAAVAVAAALLLGEYAFAGPPVIGAGVIVGLFVSEATTTVARSRSALLAFAGAVLTVGGLLGAAWISSDRRLSTVGVEGWLAVALGAVAAAIRARPLRERPDTPPGAQEPAG